MCNQYSALADLHTFQFTVAHALGFSVSISRLLATEPNDGYAFTMFPLTVSCQRILTQEKSLQITMKSSSTQFSNSNSLYDWNLLVRILNSTLLAAVLPFSWRRCSKSKSHCDRLSVGQSVLVSSAHQSQTHIRHSRVRVPLDLWPYFTVSDLRLPFSSPPTTQAEAEAYCRQPAGTLTPGIGPRWDPWPYICSMSRHLSFFFLSLILLIDKGGVGLLLFRLVFTYYILLHWGYILFFLPGIEQNIYIYI
jgi:hypothetical protein